MVLKTNGRGATDVLLTDEYNFAKGVIRHGTILGAYSQEPTGPHSEHHSPDVQDYSSTATEGSREIQCQTTIGETSSI